MDIAHDTEIIQYEPDDIHTDKNRQHNAGEAQDFAAECKHAVPAVPPRLTAEKHAVRLTALAVGRLIAAGETQFLRRWCGGIRLFGDCLHHGGEIGKSLRLHSLQTTDQRGHGVIVRPQGFSVLGEHLRCTCGLAEDFLNLTNAEKGAAQSGNLCQCVDIFLRILPEYASVQFIGLRRDQPLRFIKANRLLRKPGACGDLFDFHAIPAPP